VNPAIYFSDCGEVAIMGMNLRTLIVLAIILVIVFALRYRNWRK